MSEYIIYLVGSILLFLIGLGCLTIKRDLIRLLMGIEIMFNAANLNFVALSRARVGYIDPFAHTLVIMAIVLDGAVIAVGLVMALNAYRHSKTVDVRRLRRLRW